MSKHTPTYTENDDPAPASSRGGTWLALVLAIACGILYWLTRAPGHTPGVPSQAVTRMLPDSAIPDILDPMWGQIVEWTGGNASLLTAFSLLCGALCVFLLASAMSRVAYPVHDRNDEDEVRRERQGRLLAGLTSGLFLGVSLPAWVTATRTMPDLFHLALLLLPFWLLSEYRRAGGTWRLLAAGAVLGAALPEYPTAWPMLPVAAILVARAMLLRASFRWRDLVLVGVAALLAAIPAYLWAVHRSMRFEMLPFMGIDGFGAHLLHYFKRQCNWLGRAMGVGAIFLNLALTFLPWAIVYLFRSDKPAWRHRAPLVLLHVMVLVVCVGVVWETPVAAGLFYNLRFMMLLPIAVLASCIGYLAGDFWIMGQLRTHREAGVGQPLRSVLGVVGICLPLSLLAAAAWHWPAASGRIAAPLDAAVEKACAALPEGGAILGNGLLDDLVEAQGLDRENAPLVLRASLADDAPYRAFLAARRYSDPRQQALLDAGLFPFLQNLLQTPEGRERVAFLDTAEPFRPLGEPVPDGILTRLAVPAPSGDELTRLVESQMPFWRELEAVRLPGPDWAVARARRDNPVAPFLSRLKLLVSKQIDNTAFLLLDENRIDEAEQLLVLARGIMPGNVSVLLNLVALARERGDENSPYIAEWEAYIATHRGSRDLWHLSELYGQVHNTGLLIRQGMMWAVSGKPRLAEKELLRTRAPEAGPGNDLRAFLGQMYLANLDLEHGEEHYRGILADNPSDPDARYALARAAIQRGDLEQARAGLESLVADGHPASAFAVEYALLKVAGGDTRGAIELLSQSDLAKSDSFLPQAILAVLANDIGDDALFRRSWDALVRRPAKSIPLRFFLAQLAMRRRDWSAAREELDRLARMAPSNPRVWELLLRVDFAEHRREFAEKHVRNLLGLDPANAFGNALLASFQRERGQYALAEASFRAAIAAQRNPDYLNDLADLLLRRARAEKRPEFLAEAFALVNEALAAAPGNLTATATHAELCLELDRLDDAESDIQTLLSLAPGEPPALLLAADLYVRRGNFPAAAEILELLDARRLELPSEALEQFRALQSRVKQARAAP